jgi:hypothetical protein
LACFCSLLMFAPAGEFSAPVARQHQWPHGYLVLDRPWDRGVASARPASIKLGEVLRRFVESAIGTFHRGIPLVQAVWTPTFEALHISNRNPRVLRRRRMREGVTAPFPRPDRNGHSHD